MNLKSKNRKAESDSKLSRYVSFESFVNMVLKKQLAFVTYDTWQDPYEGFVIKAMQTTEGRADILKWFENKKLNNLPPEICIQLLERFSKAVHLQSWTKSPETDALWRIYSHNGNSIRIETTRKNVEKIDSLKIFEVNYGQTNLERELGKIFVNNQILIHHAFLWKRNAFLHEKEIRLISNYDHEYAPVDQRRPESEIKMFKEGMKALLSKGEITQQQYDTGIENILKENTNKQGVKYISYAHIPDFIESVIVHPNATDWFVDTVKYFCESNEINFHGKSDLYTFNHR